MNDDINKVHPKAGLVMRAFARAAGQSLINDPQDMQVSLYSIQAITGEPAIEILENLGHLTEEDYLESAETVDETYEGPDIGWHFMTELGGAWLVREGVVPPELVAGFFPHTAGWLTEELPCCEANPDASMEDLMEWGHSHFERDEVYLRARDAFVKAFTVRYGYLPDLD
jgi:hypothetical protein